MVLCIHDTILNILNVLAKSLPKILAISQFLRFADGLLMLIWTDWNAQTTEE